jgi:hypothetical protein
MIKESGPQKEYVLADPIPSIVLGTVEEWLLHGNEIDNFTPYIKNIENVYQDIRESDPKTYRESVIRELRRLVPAVALKLIERISSDNIAKDHTHLNRIKVYQKLLRGLTDTVNQVLELTYGDDSIKLIVPDLSSHLGDLLEKK